jgi:hypothetical protein
MMAAFSESEEATSDTDGAKSGIRHNSVDTNLGY